MKKHTRIYYIVQQGETLYHICKRYFDMPVDTIMERNKLKMPILHRGNCCLWAGLAFRV
ncbi:MAG: LysM domain-containing protein [Saprospiraceae bacterium]